MAIPRTRPGNNPAILSYGFRPFFLLGSLYAAATILFWLPLFYGYLETSSVFVPVDWHVHEMLFGFLAAVVTGFLLTSIPNWTGRLPVQGVPLLALVLLWLAGRVAMFSSAQTGWVAAAVIDCAFLLVVAATAAVEIAAGRNWRNLKVLAPVLLAVLAILAPEIVALAAGLHAFGVGAIGTMTLAVMVRATLGHTGRELRAGRAGCFVFAAILVASAVRIAEALQLTGDLPGEWFIHLAACAWVVAFFGFATLYGGMLLRPRLRRP